MLSILIGPRVQFHKGDADIEFRNVEVWGLGVGPWVIVIRGTYEVKATLPFATGSTDTVVYGCKDVCMSPCVYMRV